MMYAPGPMPPLPRPSRPCDTCVHVEHDPVALLCLWSPPVVDGAQPWPAMARKCEENRCTRGLCGPLGHMWRKMP